MPAEALQTHAPRVGVGARGRAMNSDSVVISFTRTPAATRALALWSMHQQARGLSQRTILERQRVVLAAAVTAGQSPLEFTTEGLAVYLSVSKTQSTRAAYYTHLKAWSTWLAQQGYRDDSPLTNLPAPKVPRRLPHPITTRQLELLLASRMHRRTWAMIALGAYCGLRIHEIAKVRGEDFDRVAGLLTVDGKGGVRRHVPIHPLIDGLIDTFPADGYWFPSYVSPGKPVRAHAMSSVVGKAMHRAGIRASAHALRHWYATELVRSGAGIRTVQGLMGHSSLETTALYTQVADGAGIAAVLRLPVVPRQRRPAMTLVPSLPGDRRV